MPTNEKKLVQKAKEQVLWVTDALIPLVTVLGARGTQAYLIIVKCNTLGEYPTVSDLAGDVGVKLPTMELLLLKMKEHKLLNDNDLWHIMPDQQLPSIQKKLALTA